MTTTINIPPEADTYVYSISPTTNYGAFYRVGVYSYNNQYFMRALYRFNLSSIPTGVIINSAILRFYQTFPTPDIFYLRNIPVANRTWTEMGVTWNTKPVIESYPNIPIVVTNVNNGWVAFDITSYIVDQYNLGVKADFAIQGPESGVTIGEVYWNSKENATTTTRPYLEVVYSPVITAISMVINPITCTLPCNSGVTVTWKNNGTTSATFAPAVQFGDILIQGGSVTLAAGATVTRTYVRIGLIAGTYVVCPVPN